MKRLSQIAVAFAGVLAGAVMVMSATAFASAAGGPNDPSGPAPKTSRANVGYALRVLPRKVFTKSTASTARTIGDAQTKRIPSTSELMPADLRRSPTKSGGRRIAMSAPTSTP